MMQSRCGQLIIGLVVVLLVVSQGPGLAAAQSADPAVLVEARVDHHQLRIGDLLSYELSVLAPAGFEVKLPDLPSGTLGDWEVRSCSEQRAKPAQGQDAALGWSCVLTVWTVGDHEIPQLEISYSGNGQQGSARTQPLTVQVVSVLDEGASEIKPLKPQLVLNETANLLLIIGLAILALLVLGAIILAITYYRRTLLKRAPALARVPALDPASSTLRELDRIATLGLVRQGRLGEHYELIADVLRTFIMQSYQVPALERTTREIGSALSKASRVEQQALLVSLLREADGVKFARYLPDTEQAEQIIERARQAILASR